jgi:hypothetical protein
LNTLDCGDVLFVDEMDARFHPLLTRALIRLFQSSETNPKNAQLIFITHDTNLLDPRRFRRDQIWFVEKDRFGASHLYSLADFKGGAQGRFVRGRLFPGAVRRHSVLGGLNRLFNDGEAGSRTLKETVKQPTYLHSPMPKRRPRGGRSAAGIAPRTFGPRVSAF